MDCVRSAALGRPKCRGPPVAARRLIGDANLDNCAGRWHQSRTDFPTVRPPDETIPAQILHLVERPDLWHAIVDLAVWRAGRYRRAGQPLLPHQGWPDRSDAELRAPLGGL